jgi:hypothetical protein
MKEVLIAPRRNISLEVSRQLSNQLWFQVHDGVRMPVRNQLNEVESPIGDLFQQIEIDKVNQQEKYLIDRIKKHLEPSLLLAKYRGQSHPLAGYCYVASEAYFHLAGGKESGLKPMQISHEGVSHWFLLNDRSPTLAGSQVIDITAGQFKTPVPYSDAKGRGFLTKSPSKRTQRLLDAIQRS